MADESGEKFVLVTGASGFVGGHVVRELVGRGFTAICLVRDEAKLAARIGPLESEAIVPVQGSVFDEQDLARCLEHADAAIHLVGIITESGGADPTFHRVHVEATRSVVKACEAAGVRRYVHMSALGARPGDFEVSPYHQTKWQAELAVRDSGLDWTIFRPSLIHGPDGEFMQMMKYFATPSLRQPVMPFFGKGQSRIQPVHVKDVARCFVRALESDETIHAEYELGGSEVYTWKKLYDVCARAIHGKPRMTVSIPVPVAKFLARFLMPLLPASLVPYKFDVGQVMMSQADSVCDTTPVEQWLNTRMRPFRAELVRYADQIR